MQKTWALALLAGLALMVSASSDAEARGKRRSSRSARVYSQRSHRFVPVYRQSRYGYSDWRSRPARAHDGLDRRYRMSQRGINRSYGGRYRERWVADRSWQDCRPYASAREHWLMQRRLHRANRHGYGQHYVRYGRSYDRWDD